MKPQFTEVVEQSIAAQSVSNFIDTLDLAPERVEELQPYIKAITNGVKYGYLVLNEDGSATQILRSPIVNKLSGQVAVLELKYAARVSPEKLNDEIKKLSPHTMVSQLIAYAKVYTGEPESVIAKLERYDRNLLDAFIPVFF